MHPTHSRSYAPIATYLLFVLLFLSVTAALVSLCSYLGSSTSATAAAKGEEALQGCVFVIDAGHGGEDGGAVGQLQGEPLLEKDINLQIALTLGDLLKSAGADVVLTRTEDTLLYDRTADYKGRKKALDMAARLAAAEHAAKEGKTVLFISIHQNTFPDARYSGLQVYHSVNDPRSAALAKVIQDTAREQLAPDNDRTVKEGNSIYLLKHLTCPAVLVECGFLSNPKECAALADEAYQNRMAYAIFCALRKYTAQHLTES